MVKRVDKVRKSAILEHLLDLERQIRTELARASTQRKATGRRERRSPGSGTRDRSLASDSDGTVVPEVAQRYMH
jgi:hypothetical protein